MKKNGFSIVTLLGCCLVMVAGLLVRDAESQEPSKASAKWQHLAMTHGVESDQKLAQQINRLGDKGWELIDVENINKDGTTEKTVYYFKRPQ